MVEKLLVLPSAACAGGGSAAGAFAQPPDLVLLPGWPCRRAAQAGSQLLFYLLELPRCSSARGLRSLFTRLPASALCLQARLSGRRHPAPGAEDAADGGSAAWALLCVPPDLCPCLVSFPRCDSLQNLFTSILSGSRAVPRARLRGIHFETKMNIYYAGFFFLAFLKAFQGPLHKRTRCGSCQSSPDYFFQLE